MPRPTIFIIITNLHWCIFSHWIVIFANTHPAAECPPRPWSWKSPSGATAMSQSFSAGNRVLAMVPCFSPGATISFQKNSFLATTAHLAARPRLTPLPTPARSCGTPSIRKPSLWFHQKRSASRALPLLQKAGAEVLCRRVPAPPHLPHAPQAPRRWGGGGRRHGQRGREGLQGHRRPQPR